MEKRVAILTLIILLSLIIPVFTAIKIMNLSGRAALAGNIILNIEENFKQGDKLTGSLSLNLNPQTKTPVLILLTKNNTALKTHTITLNELLKKSKKISEKTYVINLSDIVEYTFEEPGEYELLISILESDINLQKKFIVD